MWARISKDFKLLSTDKERPVHSNTTFRFEVQLVFDAKAIFKNDSFLISFLYREGNIEIQRTNTVQRRYKEFQLMQQVWGRCLIVED